jgi:hypothetical protein
MRQEINFYQPEFRNEEPIFGAKTLIKGSGAIVLTMLLAYAFAAQKIASIDNELAIVSQQEVAAMTRLEKIRPVINAVSGEQSWADRLEEATQSLEQKQLVLSLVQGSTLGDTLGFSRYLRSLARQDTDGLWLTQINLSASRDKNRLQGKALRAELVATYLQNLAEEPPFAAQRFYQFQIDGPDKDDSGIVTFSMDSDANLIASTAVSQ